MKAESLRLFDVQSALGPVALGTGLFVSTDDVLQSWERLGISGGLMRWGFANRSADILYENDRLYEMTSVEKSMMPCPVVAPSAGSELDSETVQVKKAVERGAGAAWIRPAPDAWSTEPWCSDKIFSALTAQRLPVFCQAEHVSATEVAGIATRFPELPIVFSGVLYTDIRAAVALLLHFQNVFLSIAPPWCAHLGLEYFEKHKLADQIVFGTGYPEAEPGAALGYLHYADLPIGSKERIACGNVQRLFSRTLR